MLEKQLDEFLFMMMDLSFTTDTFIGQYSEIRKALEIVQKILDFEVKFLQVDSETLTQNMTKSSLRKILHQHVFDQDVHNLTCGKCSFHTETLEMHSIMTMLYCMSFFLKEEVHDMKLHVVGLMGLLHDVGKRHSVKEINQELCYPCHGEIGCSILLRLWNTNFEPFITEEEWKVMCGAINLHMCGYHEETLNSNTMQKWNLLSVHPYPVKRALYVLSFGDTFAAGPKSSEALNSFLKSRDSFKNIVVDSVQDISTDKKGVLIQVLGSSSSGKSSFVEQFCKELSNKGIFYCVATRDTIMIEVVEEKWGKQINYAAYRQIYADHKLSKLVNERMNVKICQALDSNSLVIVDTVAVLYNAAKFIIPQNARNALKISIFIDRGEEIQEQDGKRLNISLEEQLKLFGQKSAAFTLPCIPTPTDTKLNLNLFNLSAISTSRNFSKASECSSRPHIVLHYFWNKASNRDTFIGHYIPKIQSIIGRPIPTDEMNPISLLNHLGSCDKIQSFFSEQGYTVSIYGNGKLVCIKYMDGRVKWKTAWGRSLRGSVFLWNGSSWEEIKHVLQAGAEMYTGYHDRTEVEETQDYNQHSGIDHLSAKQQEIHFLFKKNKPFKHGAIFTSKSDGAFCVVNVYQSHLLDVLLDVINHEKNAFAQRVALYSYEYWKGKRMIVISTSGTWCAGPRMQDYIVSSMLSAFDIQYNGETELEALELVLPTLILKIDATLNSLENTHIWNASIPSISFHFEAVCKNRTTFWGNHHPELAISYPKGMLTCLGCATAKQFYTHAQIEDAIEAGGWDQPYYWNITHTKKIEIMLAGLDGIIKEKMTHDQFLTKFPPSNRVLPHNQVLHKEGGVLLVKNDSTPFSSTDYSKVKTQVYYCSHKLNMKNFAYLATFPSSAAESFWAIRVVLEFSNNFSKNFGTMICEIIQATQCFVTSEETKNLLPLKAKKGFEARDLKTQAKIILNNNNCSSIFQDWKTIFVKYFPSIPGDRALDFLRSLAFKKHIDISCVCVDSDPAALQTTIEYLLKDHDFQACFFDLYGIPKYGDFSLIV